MSTKTETPKLSQRAKNIAELSGTMLEKNNRNKKAMFAFFESDDSLKIVFKETKRQRISDTYAVKTVKDLANKVVKNIFDETGKDTSAVAVLVELRDAEKCQKHLTVGRINAYARILGNRFDCLLTDSEVVKAINAMATAIVKAIPQG